MSFQADRAPARRSTGARARKNRWMRGRSWSQKNVRVRTVATDPMISTATEPAATTASGRRRRASARRPGDLVDERRQRRSKRLRSQGLGGLPGAGEQSGHRPAELVELGQRGRDHEDAEDDDEDAEEGEQKPDARGPTEGSPASHRVDDRSEAGSEEDREEDKGHHLRRREEEQDRPDDDEDAGAETGAATDPLGERGPWLALVDRACAEVRRDAT